VFAKHLDDTHHKSIQFDPPKHTIIIKADLAWTSTGNPVRPGMAKIIYESCGDHFCNYNQNKKLDPYLCLYNGCELMLGNNINVSKGEANGTRGIFKGIRMKPGEKIHVTCLNGYYVNSVYASQVESVECEHTESKYTGSFIVEPKKVKCIVGFRLYTPIRYALNPGLAIIKVRTHLRESTFFLIPVKRS
jgi:hypothetical protein